MNLIILAVEQFDKSIARAKSKAAFIGTLAIELGGIDIRYPDTFAVKDDAVAIMHTSYANALRRTDRDCDSQQ